MASSNKTSFNLRFVPVTGYGSAYTHQKPEHRAEKLKYVHKDRIHLNESWHKEYQANGHPKTLRNYLNYTKREVKKLTKRSMQKKAEDKVIGEAVVVIDENTKMEELQTLGAEMEKEFGWTCVQIHIHKDEGYLGPRAEDMKHREGKYNLHAHMFFITTDLKTGKSWKIKKGDGSVMQDITSRVLKMERGVRKTKQKKTVPETPNVVEFKFREIERTKKELNEKKESLERQVGELERSKETAENLLKELNDNLNSTNSELDDVKDEKEKELNALDSAKKELEGVKGEREGVRKDMNELKAGFEKALNSFTKPKIDEFVGKHTKKILKGLGGSKVNWEGVLNDYSQSASSYIAKLEAEKRELDKVVKQKDQTIQEKVKEKEKLIDGFDIEMTAVKEELGVALGNPFKSFLSDMLSFFGPWVKNLLSMSISIWNGTAWKNEREGHEYTADKDRGKLLINGETMEERRSRLSQEREEQKTTQSQKKSRGIKV